MGPRRWTMATTVPHRGCARCARRECRRRASRLLKGGLAAVVGWAGGSFDRALVIVEPCLGGLSIMSGFYFGKVNLYGKSLRNRPFYNRAYFV